MKHLITAFTIGIDQLSFDGKSSDQKYVVFHGFTNLLLKQYKSCESGVRERGREGINKTKLHTASDDAHVHVVGNLLWAA